MATTERINPDGVTGSSAQAKGIAYRGICHGQSAGGRRHRVARAIRTAVLGAT